MVPLADDGGNPAPIDRSILELLQSRLTSTNHVEQAVLTDASGHLKLSVTLGSAYYPAAVEEAILTVRWYTNDDFKIHYREDHDDNAWECRWDRHPNPHNTRDHFHPPPAAPTPGEDAAWPADYRDVLTVVLDRVNQRITGLWEP
jgi:hypothetical protein